MTQINQFLIPYGGLILFVTVFVDQSGLPLPVEPFLLAAGALAAGGKLSLFAAISCVALGCLAADMIWFYLGLRGQERLFRVFPGWASIKHTIPRGLDTRVILRGMWRLTAAKFLPFGTVIPLRAGALEVGMLRFLLLDALSSVVYAAVYVLLGFIFHAQLEQVAAFVRKLGVAAFLLLLIAVGAYFGWAILKRAAKRPNHFSQSGLPLQAARGGSGTTQASPVGTLANSQTTKS
jgi:membrane protein DedA with SNARE-associated domain